MADTLIHPQESNKFVKIEQQNLKNKTTTNPMNEISMTSPLIGKDLQFSKESTMRFGDTHNFAQSKLAEYQHDDIIFKDS